MNKHYELLNILYIYALDLMNGYISKFHTKLRNSNNFDFANLELDCTHKIW